MRAPEQMVCIEGEKAQLAVLEAIAIRLEAIAIRLEAIATRVEVLTSRPRRIDPEARIEPKGPNHMTLVAWSQPLRSLPTPSTALGVKRVDSGWLKVLGLPTWEGNGFVTAPPPTQP